MTKFIVRTVPERNIDYLIQAIPNLIVVKDRFRNAMDTFYRSLEEAGDDAVVNMEDDIILCDDFYNEINKIIAEHPDDVIQFFSMRKDDLTIGTRYINGSRFMANLCFYMPKGMSKDMLEWAKVAKKDNGELYAHDKEVVNGAGYDILMSYYFKAHKIKYLNWCPNLVNHKVARSAINSKRPQHRVSLTFDLRKKGK